jgi:hypothetical protein
LAATLDDLGRERNIRGDDQIAGGESLQDLVVGDIKPR